jgi:hypothetical protein
MPRLSLAEAAKLGLLPKRGRKPFKAKKRDLEGEFYAAFRRLAPANTPQPERQYRWSYPRRHKADFAWPSQKIIVEIQGGTFAKKRMGHTGASVEDDYARTNLAQRLGWVVLQYGTGAIEKRIVEVVEEIVNAIKERTT